MNVTALSWVQIGRCFHSMLPRAAGNGAPPDCCSAPMHGAAGRVCAGASAGPAALAGAQAC